MFVRLFVDENLDRIVPISKQPKEKIQAIIDSCTRQFPEFAERARKRIRTYLKSCRRNKRGREGTTWDAVSFSLLFFFFQFSIARRQICFQDLNVQSLKNLKLDFFFFEIFRLRVTSPIKESAYKNIYTYIYRKLYSCKLAGILAA